MDYAGAKEYLFGLKSKGSKYGIDRMRLFVEKLGHPESRLKIIHVAGTNGKGSVSAMCEAICRAAGYRTGLYTSPHLVRLGERVQVNRKILSEQKIIDYTLQLRGVAESIAAAAPQDHPTFFEFMTAMAFLHFVNEKADVAIIEAGMGGRLDATNVVNPEIAAITSIGLDHCEQLGHTLPLIAKEKAGIIKPGKPVVIGLMAKEARDVIGEIARERNAPIAAVEDRFGTDSANWPATVLAGRHQRANAATATLVFEMIRDKLAIGPEDVARGLSTVEWAGRWETRKVGGKQLIFDAAHNPEGSAVLDAQLAELVAVTGRRPVVVAGALGDTRARALLEVIAGHARQICLFQPSQPRATPVDVLRKHIPAFYDGNVSCHNVGDVFSPSTGCSLGEPGDTIVITGSIYLIGEIMERLEESSPAGEGSLQD